MSEDVDVQERSRLYNAQDEPVGEILYAETHTEILIATDRQDAQKIAREHGLREEHVIDFWDKKCTVEDKLPCKVKTVLGFAIETSESNGLPLPPKLQKIDEEQAATVTDAKAALAEWRDSMPADFKDEANEWVSILNESVDGKLALE